MAVVINGDTGITQAGEFNSDSTMGFKNRIINGAMVIDQRNAGASVTVDGTGVYTVDRWQAVDSTDGAFSGQQDSSAPAGFVNSLKITTTTADATLTTTQSAIFRQSIEGTNTADLAWGTASAKTVALSFWVRSSLTGTFGGAVRNFDASRSYPFTYTISVADTWEQKSIEIEGDTSGTWLTTTGIGVQIAFGLGIGPDRSGTADAWAGANVLAPTGAVSVIGTLSATWYVTGVQLEVGSVATSFDLRSIGTELALCQRYYYRVQALGAGTKLTETGYSISTTQAFMKNPFQVRMRSAPSALEQSGTATDYVIERCGAGTFTTCSAVPTINSASTWSGETTFTVASGLVNSNAGSVYGNNTSAFLAWSAEI